MREWIRQFMALLWSLFGVPEDARIEKGITARRCFTLVSLFAMMLSALWGTAACGSTDSGKARPKSEVIKQEDYEAEAEDDASREIGVHSVDEEDLLDPDGSYTTKEDVARYLVQYGKLPSNFIKKEEARALGWSGGSLEPYAPGKCIGGDRFGNFEGLLPDVAGREYYECDINTLHKKNRGPERIVYSDDTEDIYYTKDHYLSFEQLYDMRVKRNFAPHL